MMNDPAILRRAADLLEQQQKPPGEWSPEIRSQAFVSEREQRTLTTASGLTGTEYARWLSANVEVYSAYARHARRLRMTDSILSFPRQTAGIVATVVAEATPVPEADVPLEQVECPALKYAVLTRTSTEFMQDAVIDGKQWLADQHAAAIANAVEEDGWAGVISELTAAGRVSTGAMDMDHILEAAAGVANYARPQAKVFCSPALAATLERISRTAGGSSVRHMEGAWRQHFCGMEVVATTAIQDALIIADLPKAAILGNRLDGKSLILDQTYAASDEVGLLTSARYAFGVDDTNAAILVEAA